MRCVGGLGHSGEDAREGEVGAWKDGEGWSLRVRGCGIEAWHFRIEGCAGGGLSVVVRSLSPERLIPMVQSGNRDRGVDGRKHNGASQRGKKRKAKMRESARKRECWRNNAKDRARGERCARE